MSFILFLIIAVLASLGVWLGIPAVFRWQASRELARRARAQRAIVLTYDDGPSDALTPRLADLLKRRQVRATFFVIGRNVNRHPETICRLLNEGHEVGNHSYNHLNAWKTGPFRAVQDIRNGAHRLKSSGGSSIIFRPPFGKSTLLTLLYSLLSKIRQAFWTHDSRDSWNRLSAEHILEQLRMTGGGVILMHDFDIPKRGPTPEDHPDYVLNLTEKIIDFAETNNFRIICFSELLTKPKVNAVKGSI